MSADPFLGPRNSAATLGTLGRLGTLSQTGELGPPKKTQHGRAQLTTT